jgi:hypothetical protein
VALRTAPHERDLSVPEHAKTPLPRLVPRRHDRVRPVSRVDVEAMDRRLGAFQPGSPI